MYGATDNVIEVRDRVWGVQVIDSGDAVFQLEVWNYLGVHRT